MPPGTPEVPVAIVGAGACGLTAALMLRDAGIACVLLERDARVQGSTALSSGFIPAAGTRVQRESGVTNDSADIFAQDIQAKARGTAAPHLVAAYTGAIAPAMDALQSRHGLAFELLGGFLYPGHSALRMHSVPEKTGAALSFYLSNFADYNATYGSLGAAIGLMMWMWLTTSVVLVGAELDSEIDKLG